MNRLCTFVAATVLAVPAFVFAGQNQKAAPASSGGEKAAPAPAAPSGGSTTSPSSSGGGGVTSGSHGGGGTYSGGGARSTPRAGAMGGSGTVTTRGGRAHTQDGDNDSGSAVPRHSRPSEGRPTTGTAVPRGPNNPRPGNNPVYVIPGYYGGYGFHDPWLYGGGIWGAYYGGYYDPWFGGGYFGQSATYESSEVEGALKLKIKPKNAEVYVDGYYVGVVDDFDGIFQKLHLDSGTHRIEVRAEGYEALAFNVRVQADHTTTYQGELKRIQ